MPFLSCSLTSFVAQACRVAGGVDDDVELVVLALLGVELLGVEALEFVDGLELLPDRSSLRFSSARRPSSPRGRLLRQSPRLPRPRERSRLSSELPLSDREFSLGGCA